MLPKMYSDLGNQSQVYKPTLKLSDICQGNESIYHKLFQFFKVCLAGYGPF